MLQELLQLLPQAGGGVGNTHPAALPEFVFKPALTYLCDTHQIHDYTAAPITLVVLVAAQRFPRDYAPQARFLFGFADGCIAGPFAIVDRTLRDDPPFPSRGRHQSHFDSLLANP